MSDPHSPKFIIAPCEAAAIKLSVPHHSTSLLLHYETHITIPLFSFLLPSDAVFI